MGECEFFNECIFINYKMPVGSPLGNMFKKIYCHGDNTFCARYKVGKKLGGEKVPNDLSPIMVESVNEIIANG